MQMADDTHARKVKRRDARARRSAWLGRLLFSLTGMGLLLTLRLYPGTIEATVLWFHDVPTRSAVHQLDAPVDVNVRRMPTDVVPVRRGGALAPHQGQSGENAHLQQARAVQNQLQSLDPGR